MMPLDAMPLSDAEALTRFDNDYPGDERDLIEYKNHALMAIAGDLEVARKRIADLERAVVTVAGELETAGLRVAGLRAELRRATDAELARGRAAEHGGFIRGGGR